MKNKRFNKGITLIALVITIIVLMIIAGVTINIILGENNIINKTKTAKNQYSNAQADENDKLSKYEELITSVISSRGETVTINTSELTALITQIVEDKVNNASGTPTGSILAQMGNDIPSGYLYCNGTEYNISDYTNLANYIKNQFGSYNYFGGDGNTTFAVPNLNGNFLKGSNTAGISEEAGLPNIVGKMGNNTLPNSNEVVSYEDSALYRYSIGGGYGHTSNGSYNRWAIGFDASRSNSIYGKSETVTPINTSVLYCIKY